MTQCGRRPIDPLDHPTQRNLRDDRAQGDLGPHTPVGVHPRLDGALLPMAWLIPTSTGQQGGAGEDARRSPVDGGGANGRWRRGRFPDQGVARQAAPDVAPLADRRRHNRVLTAQYDRCTFAMSSGSVSQTLTSGFIYLPQ